MPDTRTRKIRIQLLQLQGEEEGAVRGAKRHGENDKWEKEGKEGMKHQERQNSSSCKSIYSKNISRKYNLNVGHAQMVLKCRGR